MQLVCGWPSRVHIKRQDCPSALPTKFEQKKSVGDVLSPLRPHRVRECRKAIHHGEFDELEVSSRLAADRGAALWGGAQSGCPWCATGRAEIDAQLSLGQVGTGEAAESEASRMGARVARHGRISCPDLTYARVGAQGDGHDHSSARSGVLGCGTAGGVSVRHSYSCAVRWCRLLSFEGRSQEECVRPPRRLAYVALVSCSGGVGLLQRWIAPCMARCVDTCCSGPRGPRCYTASSGRRLFRRPHLHWAAPRRAHCHQRQPPHHRRCQWSRRAFVDLVRRRI